MRSRFDEQLILLNKKMTQMGALCEELIAFVAKALLNGDIEGAREVKSRGQEIDHMEREIEAICLRLLLQQQPVAKDLIKHLGFSMHDTADALEAVLKKHREDR